MNASGISMAQKDEICVPETINKISFTQRHTCLICSGRIRIPTRDPRYVHQFTNEAPTTFQNGRDYKNILKSF